MDEQALLVSVRPPDPAQKRLVVISVVVMTGLYMISTFFSQVRLGRLDIFVPLLDAALFIIDLMTAVLLYVHVSVLGARSLLALANGYLFTALIIVVHALTFPHAFSATVLLGARIETSNYLQILWRAGLPCAAIAYVLLKHREPPATLVSGTARSSVVANIAVVCLAVLGLTWLVTVGAGLLPDVVMVDEEQRRWAVDPPVTVPLEVIAIVLVWWRRQSALDDWLLVVLWAWLVASLLVSLTGHRFSLVWYESRAFGLLASSLVLLGLLTQITSLYTRLAVSMAMQRRERENRLMQVDATLAVVSHEMHQPLVAIALNGSAGLHELAKPVPDRRVLNEIVRDMMAASDRAADIINNIRAMFRHGDHANKMLDIRVLVEGALILVGGDLRVHNIVVETAFGRGLPLFAGNRTQFQQVLMNLLMNAIEAMATVTERPRLLRVRTLRQGDDIVVEIQDSGPGIDPAINDGVFDPFITTKSGGLGLGLPICRLIVESHGGQLLASPAAVHGTVFRFTCPVSATLDDATA